MADDGDSARSGLGRRLALLRVWSAAVTLLPAIGLVPHGGWPLLAVGVAVEAVQAALSFRLVRQIRDGREGELLYVAGGRVPRRMVQTQQLVERVGLGISAVGIVGLTLLATPWTLIHAGLSVVLWATVFLSLRVQWRSTRLLFLLHDHRQEEALALSERWRKGRFGTLLTQLHVIALLMNRRVVEARRLRAEAWNGSVDRAALGIALDGDADRVLFVDPQHGLLDGDDLIWMMASRVDGPLVGTVMSNGGLGVALGDRLLRSKVGDANVAALMQSSGARVGAETSGHVLFSDGMPTGDGLYAALRLFAAVNGRLPLPSSGWSRWPVEKTNIRFSGPRVPLERLTTRQEAEAAGNRTVVRYSGTEPKLRILVEGVHDAKGHTEAIAAQFRRLLATRGEPT